MFCFVYTMPFWDTAYGGGPITACEMIKKYKKRKKEGEKKTSLFWVKGKFLKKLWCCVGGRVKQVI